jgi:TolA-binding protein
LRRQDYAAVEAAAREILKVRHAPRAVDAHFLLAQSFTGRRDYDHAADAYDDAYDDARTGPRAQDALLGMANALSNLGKKRNACSTLDKLKKEFPVPRPDLVAPINAVRQQAACH